MTRLRLAESVLLPGRRGPARQGDLAGEKSAPGEKDVGFGLRMDFPVRRCSSRPRMVSVAIPSARLRCVMGFNDSPVQNALVAAISLVLKI